MGLSPRYLSMDLTNNSEGSVVGGGGLDSMDARASLESEGQFLDDGEAQRARQKENTLLGKSCEWCVRTYPRFILASFPSTHLPTSHTSYHPPPPPSPSPPPSLAHTEAMRTVRAWLRLLVFYHSPAVAQHLDRVVPGWEGDCDNNEHGMSTSNTSQAVINNNSDNNNNNSNLSNTSNNNNNDNDNNGENFDQPENTTHDTTPTGGGQGEKGGGGCVPLRWLCGFFTGSLPADQVCVIIITSPPPSNTS